jgi:hypothetical protein
MEMISRKPPATKIGENRCVKIGQKMWTLRENGDGFPKRL